MWGIQRGDIPFGRSSPTGSTPAWPSRSADEENSRGPAGDQGMSAAAPATPLVAPRPAPVHTLGVAAWLRQNLFADWKNTIGTVIVAAVLLYWLWSIFDWGVVNAEVRPDAAVCRA